MAKENKAVVEVMKKHQISKASFYAYLLIGHLYSNDDNLSTDDLVYYASEIDQEDFYNPDLYTLYSYMINFMKETDRIPTEGFDWDKCPLPNKEWGNILLASQEVLGVCPNVSLLDAIAQLTGYFWIGDTKYPKARSLENIQSRVKEFLVPEIIPKKDITIIGGDGGSGKSFFTCELVAKLSQGKHFYMGDYEGFPEKWNEPLKTLMLSGEDSASCVLKPRLSEAEADWSKVAIIDTEYPSFSDVKIKSDLLEMLIKRFKPDLLVIDPLECFIASTINTGQRNQMRDQTTWICELMNRYNFSTIIVCHTNKREGVSGRNKLADSSDLWDSARSVIMTGKTVDGYSYACHEKSNYGKQAKSMIYSIADTRNKVGRFQFIELSNKKQSDFVAENSNAVYREYNQPKRDEAKSRILECLGDRKKHTSLELDQIAREHNISQGTMKNAKAELVDDGKIRYVQEPRFGGKHYVQLCVDEE